MWILVYAEGTFDPSVDGGFKTTLKQSIVMLPSICSHEEKS